MTRVTPELELVLKITVIDFKTSKKIYLFKGNTFTTFTRLKLETFVYSHKVQKNQHTYEKLILNF